MPRVKIGVLWFTIEHVAGFEGDTEDHHYLSEVNYLTCTIRFRKGLSVSQRQACLLHETIHVILYQAGLQAIENNEMVTTALEYGLASLFENYTVDGLYALTLEDAP